jgi:NodT family efflux transporter outer membrane factor (OMF) lipoprotein
MAVKETMKLIRTTSSRRRSWSPLQFRRSRNCLLLVLAIPLLGSTACIVGPKYQRPTTPVPGAYKEQPPPSTSQALNWNTAHPNDAAVRGKWWEIFNDPELNELENQVSISNQNVLAVEAQFRAARDSVRIARSGLFPTATAGVTYNNSRTSSTMFNVAAGNLTSGQRSIYNLPVDISYQADIWGSNRRTVRGTAESAQATAAQLENVRLAVQAALAQDYFELHGVDSERALLEQTVKSYQEYLQLTKDRQASGVASGADVAQAETQLKTAQAQLIDLGVARAQFEHAIAILTGKPPAEVTISASPTKSPPPDIPAGIPSDLLQRRPDVAAAERQMAAVNEQIGIARAAYFPTLLLTGSVGLESGSIAEWFTWPSRIWSVGPQVAETVFDAGRRRAQSDLARADFDLSVANYRQTVLAAFQQVEDNLAVLRVLEDESRAENEAVKAAQQSLDVSTYQYKAGVASYLQVITAQAFFLQDQLASVNILARRMAASVLLIEALGGGWNASTLPTVNQLTGKR